MSQPALTTTFKPAPSCFASLIIYTPTDTKENYTGDRLGPSPSATQCYPSGWKAEREFYFSPGICPSGYLTADTSVVQIGTASETVVNCCPSSWTWTTDINNRALTSCLSYYNEADRIARTMYVYTGTRYASIFTGSGGGYAIASAVHVRYQATDQAVLTPVSSVTQTATITATVTPEGLNTGAKAGIGVGAALGVLLLVAIGVIIWLLRARKQKRDQEQLPGIGYSAVSPGTYDAKHEHIDHPQERVYSRELAGTPIANNSDTFELDGDNTNHTNRQSYPH